MKTAILRFLLSLLRFEAPPVRAAENPAGFDLVWGLKIRKEELIKPGEINRYVFDSFSFFSRQIARESRLRLVLTCPNSIFWQKNYNSGGVVSDETGKDAHTAHVTLYHDAEHPSALELPVVKR